VLLGPGFELDIRTFVEMSVIKSSNMLFTTHKKKMFSQEMHEARVLESQWWKERQPLSGFQILIANKHLYSQNISVESSVLLEIDFLCVCVRRKKGRFSVILAVMGYQNTCVFVLAAQITWWDWRLIFRVHQKCQMHFYMLLKVWNARKGAFHMILSSFKVK